MKTRFRLTAIVVPLGLTSVALAIMAWLLISGTAQAATCDVPTTHSTIQSAVDDASCDTLNLTSAVYTENITVTRDVTIQGKGALSTTVDGNANGSVFTIQPNLVVTLTDMTVTNGRAHRGGGIHNKNSMLVVSSVTIFSNTAQVITSGLAIGGGIYNDGGNLILADSIIMDNAAHGGWGGGAYNADGGTMRMISSTVTGNWSETGSIYNRDSTLEIVGSLVTSNTANGGYGAGIASLGVLTVADSIIRGNMASSKVAWGGGIVSFGGTVLISNTTVSRNGYYISGAVGTRYGGGIYSYESETRIVNSTISDNVADYGGGVVNQGSSLYVDGSLIARNEAFKWGGGIWNVLDSNLAIINSTLSDNRWISFQGGGGGGINNFGTVAFSNVTLSGNSGPQSRYDGTGGGIYNESRGTMTVTNSIVNDSTHGGDCGGSGTIVSLGHNIAGDDTCSFAGPNDLNNTNPHLGPLLDNGGDTLTHALLPGSQAIDGGDNSSCPSTDQRGVGRPWDGDGDGSANCDIGAYEYDGPPVKQLFLPLVLRP